MALGYVRPARPDDAGEIARIQLTTWRYAYRRLLPRRVLDALDEGWMERRWRASIEAPPSPRHRVLVAVEQADQSYLVGLIAAGPVDVYRTGPDYCPHDRAMASPTLREAASNTAVSRLSLAALAAAFLAARASLADCLAARHWPCCAPAPRRGERPAPDGLRGCSAKAAA